MGKLIPIEAIVIALLASPVAADSLERWAAQISEAGARFGLPEKWIRAVMCAESGGAVNLKGRPIVSPAGAMGLMQLMPGTWRDMRSALGLGSDPFNPRDNIIAGAAYLRLMYDRFGYPDLFAAYNAGPARYEASLARGISLPPETRVYVRRITRFDKSSNPVAGTSLSELFPVSSETSPGLAGSPSRKGLFVQLRSDRQP